MIDDPTKTLRQLVAHVGRYPAEAFVFVQEGLSYAAEHVHGTETEGHRLLQQYLAQNNIDWNDLITQYHAGGLPGPVVEAIDAAGGCEKLNRHVSGRELCWALRDYALRRWGILARVVLETWGIKATLDFGRIVFGFIDLDMMRKQDGDSIEDFNDVYDFKEAFDEPFGGDLPDNTASESQD